MNRRLAAVALVALALCGTLSLSGCSVANLISTIAGGDKEPPRDDDTGEITEEGDLDVFSIAVGDCLGETPEGEVESVTAVPCSESHDGEVFYDFSLPDGEFPGDDALVDAVYAGCDPAFETFVGLPYDESSLDYTYYAPTAESWAQLNDRLVSCVITDPNGPVTGSLQGAGR